MISLPHSVFVLFFVISLAYCDTSLFWGESGAGKSSELNCLAGKTLAKEALVHSGQEQPEFHTINNDLFIDIPGFISTRGTTDDQIRDRIWNSLREHSDQLNGGIDHILIVVPSRGGRSHLKNMLAQAFMLFSPDSIRNMVFLFNYSPSNPHIEEDYDHTLQLVTALGGKKEQILKLDAKNCTEVEKRFALEKMRTTSPGEKLQLSDSSETYLQKWATNYFDNVLMKDPANYKEKIEKIPRVEKRVVPVEVEVEEVYNSRRTPGANVPGLMFFGQHRAHKPSRVRRVKKTIYNMEEVVVVDTKVTKLLKHSEQYYREKARKDAKKQLMDYLDRPAIHPETFQRILNG